MRGPTREVLGDKEPADNAEIADWEQSDVEKDYGNADERIACLPGVVTD
jgi:hypothetical protein